MAHNHKKMNHGEKRGNGGKIATIARPGNGKKSAPSVSPFRNDTNISRPSGNTSVVERKPTEVTRQQISEAAYFLWKQRGGSEVSNWLEAERMLKSRIAR
jgi:Protein of unknown function (DUF2934)